ncbi:hypothetical protein mRhiFer1_008563 [Rhinolophus ferrumequinum]|uniref:Uncharacterized protein n=1 Tax=Rhinolophus ferrumequinum TaxID=59479 RepID=A0A7J7UJE8_RHIFE|nr:hypothetical protein mRhiFer1_008563 [Rhinolophus ferrumequinum]
MLSSRWGYRHPACDQLAQWLRKKPNTLLTSPSLGILPAPPQFRRPGRLSGGTDRGSCVCVPSPEFSFTIPQCSPVSTLPRAHCGILEATLLHSIISVCFSFLLCIHYGVNQLSEGLGYFFHMKKDICRN